MSDADNLEIKKRARRRLVGAAALALTAAIVLPMMMEQEPAPSSPDIQVTIPDRDSAPAPGRPDADVRTTETASPPAPVEEPPQPGMAEPPPRPAASSAEMPRAAAPAPKTGDEEARVRALLDGKPPASAVATAPAAPAVKEGYVLQIGAFSDPAKAGSISSELKQAGFSAYTEKAGAMTRVRVGPFTSRDEAEKIAARLKAQGRNVVLTPR